MRRVSDMRLTKNKETVRILFADNCNSPLDCRHTKAFLATWDTIVVDQVRLNSFGFAFHSLSFDFQEDEDCLRLICVSKTQAVVVDIVTEELMTRVSEPFP